MMKNQPDYFDKIIKVLKDLKKDHPNCEFSTHYILATGSDGWPITDGELYRSFIKYKSELDMNTLSDEDMEKVIKETDDLFREVDLEDEDLEEY